jgi:hypothetical protein
VTDDTSYERQNRSTWATAYKSLCVDESARGVTRLSRV